MTETPNEGEEDTRQHELVIIRRRNDGDEAPHKGGVWKIAHADFMTALMAFFLVMWLINATDDKTVTGIANYFNPMRLSEATTKPKGVFTMEAGSEQEGKEQGNATKPTEHKGKHSNADKKPPKNSEAALFSDPYEALDEIAAQAAKEAPPRAITEKGNVPAHHTGEEFRDPFDPDFQHGQFQQGKVGGETGKKDDGAATTAKSDSDKSEPSHASGETAREGSDNEKSEVSPAKADKGHEADRDRESKRADLKREIQEAVARAGFPIIPGIDVQATPDGLLISITDQYNFEMFGIASARPKPELVVLMEKIGGVIAKRPEHLVIRGHTDGRPFRSQDYDNWRLSAARAQMANYMLVRSGVTEARVDRIEGYADHNLRVRDDPLAARNRRIEILLEESKP